MRLLPIVVVALLLASCTSGANAPEVSSPAGPTTNGSSSNAAPESNQISASNDSSSPNPSLPTYPDWPTYHGDFARTGVSIAMPPSVGAPVRAATVTLDGAVYASPIVVAGVTIAATEHDTVYGLDSSGRQLWRVNLGTPAPKAQLPCGNIDPLGITGTPVYDSSTKLVYLVAEQASPPRHELVALSPTNGVVNWKVSVDLPGVSAAAMQERGALTITGGSVWVPFGGLAGDCSAYKGRVIGVPLDGAHAPLAFTVPTSREGGIWTPPGPSVDASGHLLVSVGNGASGVGDPYDYSDSVLELDGTRMVDSFSPTTWPTDNDNDLDLGSQGPALVGTQWIFIAGKSGTAYVLRQGHLGGIGGQVSKANVCKSFGGTAVDDGIVYVPCTSGVRAVRITSSGTMDVLWDAPSAVTGSPVLGGGRLWSLDPNGGELYALSPASGAVIATVSVGATSRFATPAISGPDVIVPTLTGVVVVRTS